METSQVFFKFKLSEEMLKEMKRENEEMIFEYEAHKISDKEFLVIWDGKEKRETRIYTLNEVKNNVRDGFWIKP